MIRKMKKDDLDSIMQIWLHGNLIAHPFIDPQFWYENYDFVSQQILRAEVFVNQKDQEILSFIGLVSDYIAGIFVDPQVQSQGIGQALLNHVKQNHASLTLNVYAQNKRAYQFYRKQGFVIVDEKIDVQTNALDYTMQWKS